MRWWIFCGPAAVEAMPAFTQSRSILPNYKLQHKWLPLWYFFLLSLHRKGIATNLLSVNRACFRSPVAMPCIRSWRWLFISQMGSAFARQKKLTSEPIKTTLPAASKQQIDRTEIAESITVVWSFLIFVFSVNRKILSLPSRLKILNYVKMTNRDISLLETHDGNKRPK